jgi:hypothetical protein
MTRPTYDKEVTALLLSPVRNITSCASIAVPAQIPDAARITPAPQPREPGSDSSRRRLPCSMEPGLLQSFEHMVLRLPVCRIELRTSGRRAVAINALRWHAHGPHPAAGPFQHTWPQASGA